MRVYVRAESVCGLAPPSLGCRAVVGVAALPGARLAQLGLDFFFFSKKMPEIIQRLLSVLDTSSPAPLGRCKVIKVN